MFLVVSSARTQTLTNGGNHDGTILLNETNTWSFSGTAGDSVVLRVGRTSGSTYFRPWIQLYGPGGVLIDDTGSGTSDLAGELALTLTNSGTYTVLVADSSYSALDDTGTYRLYYFELPGSWVVSDEGGEMTNGGNHNGTNDVGDLDAWSFSGTAGDSVVLRLGRTSGSSYFRPWMRLYGPDGVLIDDTGSGTTEFAGELALTLTNNGTYTVLVADSSYSTLADTGTYQLYYFELPGSWVVSDEGGEMTNGGKHEGSIETGDVDAWSFSGIAGDSVVLRLGRTDGSSYFRPWMRLYGPDGVLIDDTGSGTTAFAGELALSLTNSGTYTVLIADGSYSTLADTGTYQLHYFELPGSWVVSDEGGEMTNGGNHEGTIDVGDLDGWSFSGTAGDSVMLRLGRKDGSSYYRPWMRLYGPDGVLIDDTGIGTTAFAGELALTLTNSGTYTVLMADGSYSTLADTGTYELNFVKAPGIVIAFPGDEGGIMTNGVTYTGTNSLGDLDAWNFYGTVGDSNFFRIVTTNFTPWLRLYGPSGAMEQEAFVANSNNRSNGMSYVVGDEGSYTLVLSAYYLTQSGTYGLKQSRVPPDLIMPDTQILNEGDALNVTISAQDPDVPFQPLTFTPIFLPPGASFLQTGPTNASITWSTTEASGPSTNTIIASVTDVVNGTPFTRTNSFVVIVNELNEPPMLTVPGPQFLDEMTTLNVFASASDGDLPANPLTYTLVSPPAGMTINSATGEINWTPTEVQGSNSYPITVVVTDSNPPAVNATQLSDTNTFTVVVREVNTPPQIALPGPQVITELTSLNVSASAMDSDFPANTFTYALISPPPGMTINPGTGAIGWIPTEVQGSNSYTVAVAVTDNNPTASNSQHLSNTNSFTVTVNEANVAPRFTSVPGPQAVTELSLLNVAVTAADDDLPANSLAYALVSPPSGMNINAGSGAISWTPTEAQGSNSYTVTVTVTDTNPAAINQKAFTVTTNFTVTVNESNAAPRFTSVPASQTITELTSLNVSVAAADDDLPANSLTYALVSPPSGMNINAGNGAITWTPTEAQGSNSYTINVTVTDTNPPAINQKSFTTTTNFTVIVNESNTAPQFTSVPVSQTITEMTPLNVSVAAQDDDLPANPLTYGLVSPPSGMSINSSSGAITWTPTEVQGPSLYTITVTVADTNAAAINQKQLVVTNSFNVTVNESNLPPVLQLITDQSIHYGVLLSVQAAASDPDVPTNTLMFSLSESPTGMEVDPGSGLITWTPDGTQVGTFPVTLRVVDNGTPKLDATQMFQVEVTGNQPVLAISSIGGNLKQLTITGDTGLSYDLLSSTNLMSWQLLDNINLTTSPKAYIDPDSATVPKRFYRLQLAE